MCRSRRDALAFQPRPLSSPNPNPNPNPNSSSTTIFPTTTDQNTNSSSSLQSISSISSAPFLYSSSDISTAITDPKTKRLSSTSFRCCLRGRDVFLHRRRFRCNSKTLPARLSDISKSHHRSLIRLLGASLVSPDSIYLAYDFVPGASLSSCLHNAHNPQFTPLSSWLSRMHIAADIAQGLDYIHQHAARGGAIHNRIDSSSVIVSETGAKICLFGAALLSGDAEKNQIEGTRGYLAPEVIAGGCATGKSDVFAFGVVILELMSGDEAMECRLGCGGKSYEWVSLIETAKGVVGSGIEERMERVRLWVDRRLKDSFPLEVAEKMVVVALRCVEGDAEKRPAMSWVQGKISQLFLESEAWSGTMRAPVEISATFAPR